MIGNFAGHLGVASARERDHSLGANLPSTNFRYLEFSKYLCKCEHFQGKRFGGFLGFSPWGMGCKWITLSKESAYDFISPTQIPMRSSPTHFRHKNTKAGRQEAYIGAHLSLTVRAAKSCEDACASPWAKFRPLSSQTTVRPREA